MVNDLLILTIIALAIIIVSIIFGIRLIKKYKRSKKKYQLVLGIILTFIIPGLIILLYLFIVSRAFVMVYAPGPMMDYAPAGAF